MTKLMLIDAAHAEETRVVVVDGRHIEELDFESQARKQLRGNIYLAKVTRVEPSLQAAFIEYGGNRHGFLAFNEIHPDYYQIPMADREALLREEAEAEQEAAHDNGNGQASEADEEPDDDEDLVDAELERRRRRLMRRYKIQEVIRRRQIMLVQVVKEERGNKGAALTTYLSLAGRYCVLMPNTARGGGISRKITTATDRKRLKAAAQSLDLPTGMGLIIRTAGAKRTKAEIKRDYEYLMRLWENIRETTLKSIAPALIYEEEDLVKRAIRDMYDKELDGIFVEGEAGYREARDFMRMIMPSQTKKIQAYREPMPLFVKHGVEDQLAQIHSPVATLKSGGYLVINQTEALVAIDVNSGRSTRERNIEATALKTNLEAAEEAARQLRLRDLAGLIVIDFIDMEEGKNNRAVEKKLKDCLKDDRARVQMGKISSFGLMEISRQRRRTGVLEGTTHVCEQCQGTGRVRSVESSALAALRAIEMEAVRGGPGAVIARLSTPVGLYILNEKRAYLARLEQAHGLIVSITVDDGLGHVDVELERTAREGLPAREVAPRLEPPRPEPEVDLVEEEPDELEREDEDERDEDDEEEPAGEPRPARGEALTDGDGRRRRRRRRRGRRDDAHERPAEASAVLTDGEEDEEPESGGLAAANDEDDAEHRSRRRRRGRRGGRRFREEGRPGDPYGWVHAHGGHDTPQESEDPYAWRDPHASSPRVGAEPRPERAPGAAVADASAASGGDATPEAYTWREGSGASASRAEGREPRRSRNRRGRGGRGLREERPEPLAPSELQQREEVAEPPDTSVAAEQADEGRAAAISEPSALAEPPPAPPAEEPAAQPEAESEPVQVAAEPAAPPEPDPAEISSPPAEPRRGWWRRRG